MLAGFEKNTDPQRDGQSDDRANRPPEPKAENDGEKHRQRADRQSLADDRGSHELRFADIQDDEDQRRQERHRSVELEDSGNKKSQRDGQWPEVQNVVEKRRHETPEKSIVEPQERHRQGCRDTEADVDYAYGSDIARHGTVGAEQRFAMATGGLVKVRSGQHEEEQGSDEDQEGRAEIGGQPDRVHDRGEIG